MIEEKEIKTIANTLLKAVIVICICAMGAVSLHSCKLDSGVIADCNEACQSSSSQMESVTSYKCSCVNKTNGSSPWVLN